MRKMNNGWCGNNGIFLTYLLFSIFTKIWWNRVFTSKLYVHIRSLFQNFLYSPFSYLLNILQISTSTWWGWMWSVHHTRGGKVTSTILAGSSLTIIHLGGPVWLTTAEEVSKFLLQCILQQNMNLLANQFLMPAFRAPCCVCKKLINEHCSIIPVPSCSLGLIYSVKDCFQAAAGWGIYLWPANFSVLRPFSLFSISWTQRLDWTLEHNIPFDRNSADILHCNIQFTRNVDITLGWSCNLLDI